MTRALFRTAAIVLSFVLPGCAKTAQDPPNAIPAEVLTALREGEPLELVSLYHDDEIEVPEGDEKLIRWKVLGRMTIDDPATRESLIAALERGAAEEGLEPAACFWPRHALSTTHDGRHYDLVICFECAQVAVYVDGRTDRRNQQQGGYTFLIADSPQPLFDRVLRDAGVTLDADVE